MVSKSHLIGGQVFEPRHMFIYPNLFLSPCVNSKEGCLPMGTWRECKPKGRLFAHGHMERV